MDVNPLALSRKLQISDMRTISYPAGISCNRYNLYKEAKLGFIRYDRDFLLQFMSVCKHRPEIVLPLEEFGLDPKTYIPITRGRAGRHRQNAAVASHQGGVTLKTLGTAYSSRPLPVEEDHIPIQNTKPTSEDRFAESNEQIFVGSSELELITPAGNTGTVHGLPTVDEISTSPETLSRDVKTLLNSLTMENIDHIADRISKWANMWENEHGHILEEIVHLVVERATENTTQSDICASLCKKMMKNISPRILNIDGEGQYTVDGSQLFCKHLRDRCLSEVHRGGTTKTVTFAPQTKNKRAAAVVNTLRRHEDGKDDPNTKADLPLNNHVDYAACEAKPQCFGIIRFIGELFKQHLLKKGVVHKCLETFIGGSVNPDEEDIESLCILLTIVGKKLDIMSPKGRAKFDRYISCLNEWTKNPNVAQRMKFLLREVIRLRERNWISDTVVPAAIRNEEIDQPRMGSSSSNDQVVVAEENGLHTPAKADGFGFGKRIQPQSISVDEKDVTKARLRQVEYTSQDGSDAASAMSTMIMPSEAVLMGGLSNVPNRCQNSEEKIVVQFLERLVGMKMCSTALVPANERQGVIESIVTDIALQAPDALRKLSLMVRGEGLD